VSHAFYATPLSVYGFYPQDGVVQVRPSPTSICVVLHGCTERSWLPIRLILCLVFFISSSLCNASQYMLLVWRAIHHTRRLMHSNLSVAFATPTSLSIASQHLLPVQRWLSRAHPMPLKALYFTQLLFATY
jgi:hypothetical protein